MASRRGSRLVAAAAAALVVLGACTQTAEDPDHPLSDVLIRSAADGFQPVEGPASGPMSIDDAAAASAADVAEKKTLLKRSGYQDGYSRVWTKGDDYVTALAHELATARSAERFVTFEIEHVGTKVGTQTFAVDGIPNANGYILSGVKRKGLEGVFCQSVWFPLGSRVFSVTTCGAQPGSPEFATELAKQQYELASEA